MAHPFDVVIGLDRSDKKADLHLIDTDGGHARITFCPRACWPRGPP
jgi:hypothetical protein